MYDTMLTNPHTEMNYNPYTPPSSNEDSPQPYVMNPSPQSFLVLGTTPTYMDTAQIQSMYNFEAQYNLGDQKESYLEMIEQPTEKFRFRYKSEMAGTHGSLNGKNSDKTRKQTYPTVELKNYHGRAIVRCSLYQYHASAKERQPHAHRLIKKIGNEEVDDPHALPVGGNEGYVAVFHSMGIIHTAKKNVMEELVRKKTLLKQEEVARIQSIRNLKTDEIQQIKNEAEEESKSINMNIVCLRFDAFTEQDNVLYPICAPIYSHSINNLKSALTGELKIVRMDHNSSPARGNREIFMLVEKVTKKNIRIRFFELDDDVETWSDYGKFSELDVHHQYAIVFRTPPYRDMQISEQRRVYVELMRITDGSKSEPREFMYYPSPNYQPGMKRSRMSYSYSTSGSWTASGERDCNIVPITIGDQNDMPSLESAELDKMFREVQPTLYDFPPLCLIGSQDFIPDGPKGRLLEQKIKHDESTLPEEEQQINDRVYSEFRSFLATKPSAGMINSMLLNLFQEHVTEHRENTLHILVKSGNQMKLVVWLEVIKRSKLHEMLNYPNKDGHTIGHLAVISGNSKILDLICRYFPDFSLLDNEGNTPLHIAMLRNAPLVMVDLLVRSKDLTRLPINAENNDSLTAFELALSKKNLAYVKVLCDHGADVNTIDKKSGYNALHISISEQAVDIVRYLIEKTSINLLCRNYQDITPLRMAKKLVSDGNDRKMFEICNIIETAMCQRGLDTEIFIKEEQESEEEEMECDLVECKPEKYTPEELQDMYKDIISFTAQCLEEVSEILEASGKWMVLAQLLDLQHIINTDMFKRAPSKSKQLLQCAEKEWTIFEIREFLENLEEVDAVVAIDKMVLSMKNM